jgi:ABC-2 type transport system permease protein
MTSAPILVARPERRGYARRCLRVIAATDFKLKYADSALGYIWAVLRPMAYFGVLLLVFGRFFKGVITPVHHFPLYLLLGIVLYTFFVEAVTATLPSLVRRADLLRRLAFPRLVIPASAVLTATITFAINIAVVALFVAVTPLAPRLSWLALPALVAELVVFTFGFSLIAASIYVRFRDVMPVWELTSQLLLFATPVMYPLSILPGWARDIAVANPLVQIMQDVRDVLIGLPASESFAGTGVLRLIAIALALATFAAGVLVFRRMEPRLAELV